MNAAGDGRGLTARDVLIVILVAIAVRAVHLAFIWRSPITEVLLIDSDTYQRFAARILDGTFRGEDVYSLNVLYPYVLASIQRVFSPGVHPVLVTQSLVDTIACALVAAIGARAFDRRVGLWAGIVAAVYGPLVFYAGTLLTPTFIGTFTLIGLFAMMRVGSPGRSRETGHASTPHGEDRAALGWAALAGVGFGLAALMRGNAILILFAAPIVYRVQTGSWRRAGPAALATSLTCLSLTGVVIARNYAVEGRFVPIAANYAAFYIGHNPGATGLYAMPSFTESASFEGEVEGTRDVVSKRLGREVTLAESSQYLFREGLRYLGTHPWDELRLTLVKLHYVWNRTESPTNLSYYFTSDFSPILRWLPHLGWLVPLVGVGVVAHRRRWRAQLALLAVGAVPVVTCLVFFVSAEYRLPLVPVVIVYAVAGVAAGVETARRARTWSRGEIAVTATITIVMSVLAFHRTPLLEAQSLKRVDYLNFGTLYRQRGDLDEARRMLTRSLEIDPGYPLAHAGLAEVAAQQGDLDGARRHRSEAARLRDAARRVDPSPRGGRPGTAAAPVDTWTLEAATLYQDGRYAEALAAFRRVHRAHVETGRLGDAIRALNNVGLCAYKLGDLDAAEAAFRSILADDSTYAYAWSNLARVAAARGDSAAAIARFDHALELEPGNPRLVRGRQALLDRLGNDGDVSDVPSSPE